MVADSNLQVTIRRHSSHQSLLHPTFLSTIARTVLVKHVQRKNLCRVLARRNGRKQRSRDAAAKKRANTSGVGKANNYCEDIYIPPYNNTH